jgi:nucleotide-binding universal stress UspA family protein
MHSADLPVAVATRGFRAKPGSRVRRVSVAYGGAKGADTLAAAAGRVAARLGATLRLAAFAVWSRPAYTMRLGAEGEDPVLADWLAGIRAAAEDALREIGKAPGVPRDLESVVGVGERWQGALEDIDWDDGEVLAVGSSGTGPLARVFLGSRGTKIIRNSPVPVIAVPRAAAEEIAEEGLPG